MTNIEATLKELYNQYKKINKDTLSLSEMLIIDRGIITITTYQNILYKIDDSKYHLIENNINALKNYINKFSS